MGENSLLLILLEVKLVQNRFSELASDPRVRFFGNVEVGKTIGRCSPSQCLPLPTERSNALYFTTGVNDLRKHYHAVVFSYGSEDEKLLNIPGEDLRRVHSARTTHNTHNYVAV